MAVYRSKDRKEIAAFCRGLEERGFHQVAATSRLIHPRLNEFRVYRGRSKWWRVSYCEPTLDGPLKVVAEPLNPAKPWAYGGKKSNGSPCNCGCRKRSVVRGLSRACYIRWRYWNVDGAREASIDRARAKRESRRAAQETVQKTVTSDPLTISTEGSNIPLVDSGT